MEWKEEKEEEKEKEEKRRKVWKSLNCIGEGVFLWLIWKKSFLSERKTFYVGKRKKFSF